MGCNIFTTRTNQFIELMISREISGKTRHFQFGTYTFKIIRQDTGLQYIEDVFTHLSNKKKRIEDGKEVESPVMSQLEHIDFLSAFLLSCAKHGAMTVKEAIDFNEVDVSNWMDEIGYESAMALVVELVESYADVEKNHKAPVMGQPA